MNTQHTPSSSAHPRGRKPAFTLLTGDALQVLRTLPTHTADCIVTSPPYWRLRDYATGTWSGGNPTCAHTHDAASATTARTPHRCVHCDAIRTDLQYGQEHSLDAYIAHLRGVFAELSRILAPTGTAWLNLGDSYAANSDGYRCTRPGQYRQPRFRPAAGLPNKNLIGMPWRVALALQADGWTLRHGIVWHKPNPAPTPVRDRLGCHYEWLFMLVQQTGVGLVHDEPGRHARIGERTSSSRAYGAGIAHTDLNAGEVWTIPVTPNRQAEHPAVFPVEIPLRCITIGCPPGGTVLDPFSGLGTTGLAARQLGRSYIGIDLNTAFQTAAKQRLTEQRSADIQVSIGAEPASVIPAP